MWMLFASIQGAVLLWSELANPMGVLFYLWTGFVINYYYFPARQQLIISGKHTLPFSD